MRRLSLLIFSISTLSAQTYSPCDINRDGATNILDVQLMINELLGVSACTTTLDQAGTCDIIDVQREVLAALGSPCNTTTAGPSIAVTAPATGATVSGTYSLSVDTSSAPTTASVEYDLGSLQLGIATAAPFTQSWNSAFASDGQYSLIATARDSTGATLAQAMAVMNINNHGGYVTVASPDFSQTLSGAVPLSITGSDPQGYYPARWQIFLDGQAQPIIWTDNAGHNPVTISTTIDTTTLTNGPHEFNVVISSNYWPANQPGNVSWYGFRLGLNRIITVNNGRTFMDVATGYEHVYLTPGQSLALSCTRLFTDNTSGLCAAPSYSSSDSSTVAVASSGLLTAGANEGFATVTLTEGGKTAPVYVWVMSNPTIPHFAGNGQMLTSYQPDKSIFPVAPFLLQPSDLQSNSTLNNDVKQAGVNTLYSGFYINPRSTTADYAAWQATYDMNVAPSWVWAATNGYHLYTMGDEIARNIGSEAWWTLNWPSAEQAVQYAMESLASSGVAIGIDMIDEGSILWGGTPTPPRTIGQPTMFTSVNCTGATCTVAWPNNPVNSGRFYAGTSFALTGSLNNNLNTPLGRMFTATNVTNSSFSFTPAGSVNGAFTIANDPNLEFLWWAGSAGGCPTAPCNPPVPNTALSTIATWLRSANPKVPISWPALGVAPPIVHDAWAGKDSQVSDYFSHYWDSYQPGATYAWTMGVAQRIYWMRSAFYQRQPYARFDRPQVMLASISGYCYMKETAGAAFYSPPQDILEDPPASGASVSAEMMTTAAIGNAGVRLYQFEEPGNLSGRVSAPLGTLMQTGASPIASEQLARQIWNGIGYTANPLTKTLQPFILGTLVSSPGLGSSFLTSARQSADGTLLMALNATDWSRTVTLNLTAYRTSNGITRYIIGGSGIKTALIADAAQDTVTLMARQSVVYLFPTSAATSYLSTIPVSAPPLPAGTVGALLHQAYIYSEDLDNQTDGTDCTASCNLVLDRSLGDVFYQFFFVDSSGRLVSKSSVNTIPRT